MRINAALALVLACLQGGGCSNSALYSVRERRALGGALSSIRDSKALAQAFRSLATQDLIPREIGDGSEEEVTRGAADACTRAMGLPLRQCAASCRAYADAARSRSVLLIDVRGAPQFAMCRLPEAVNLPAESLERELNRLDALCSEISAQVLSLTNDLLCELLITSSTAMSPFVLHCALSDLCVRRRFSLFVGTGCRHKKWRQSCYASANRVSSHGVRR